MRWQELVEEAAKDHENWAWQNSTYIEADSTYSFKSGVIWLTANLDRLPKEKLLEIPMVKTLIEASKKLRNYYDIGGSESLESKTFCEALKEFE